MSNLNDLRDNIIDMYKQSTASKNKIKTLLQNYNGEDWKEYVKVNEKSYNRHLYYSSKEFDMIIITWAEGNQCKIHNHPENGCSVKVLKGDVVEEQFDTKNFKKISENHHYINDILYIDDSLAYHRMCNKNKEPCITLHIYSPGFYVPTFFDK